jgi:hypothetical protein
MAAGVMSAPKFGKPPVLIGEVFAPVEWLVVLGHWCTPSRTNAKATSVKATFEPTMPTIHLNNARSLSILA